MGSSNAFDSELGPLPIVDAESELGLVKGPERMLMTAILVDAIHNYLTKDRNVEEQNWIFSKEKDYIFSFFSVCTSLGLDPNYLRAGLLKFDRNKPAMIK